MNPLLSWFARRLLLGVLVVLGAASAAFAALHLTPGDPAEVMLGGTATSPEAVAEVRKDLGLDRPLAAQYASFMGRLLTGDLGTSYQLQRPVTELLSEQAPPTLWLALTGFALGCALAVPLAVATAGRRPGLRRLSASVELVLISTPAFWVGVLLLALLSFRWQLFPAAGGEGVRALVLPAVTLALSLVGVFAQVLRESMEHSLGQPYALASRARGATETDLRLRHALRHSLVPLVTLSGWTIGALLSGTVIIETVFSRQGLGRLMTAAINSRDLPVVTGLVIASAALFVVVNILVDWLYPVIDPRLKEAVA
ncbi:ABC transporter permease [Streptomyces qinzhouensis]|uniref:ABC transporter permease n=1 Tax=Streptomyces qinzhouensis TaxID=2599401 RepID=A0A5B8JKN0_9ACTN|nr:ABC transporter permease [Streptomyces qinzhouensis]QDY80461.1 ABC transporter permease [Streptomyces qinzhouensis]